MLRIFRNQQPATLFILLFVLFIFRLSFFLFLPAGFESSAVIFYDLGSFLSFTLSSMVVLFQAVWLNYLITDTHLIDEKTVVPVVIWILISSLNRDFYYLGDILLVSTIYILILHLFIYTEERFVNIGRAFLIGVLSAFVFLIRPNTVLLIPFFLLIVYNQGIESIRTLFTYLLGVIAFCFWAWSGFYLFDIDFIWFKNLERIFSISFENYDYLSIAKWSILVVPGLAGAIGFLLSSKSNLAATRKNFFVFVILFFGAIVEIIFSKDLNFNLYPLLLLPSTMFISEALLIIRKNRVAEVVFTTFVLTIITLMVLELRV